jgi:hypothetical protein
MADDAAVLYLLSLGSNLVASVINSIEQNLYMFRAEADPGMCIPPANR